MFRAVERAAGWIKRKFRALPMGKRMVALYLLCAILPLIITNIYASSTLNASAQSAQLSAAERGYEQMLSGLNQTIRRQVRAGDIIALDQTLNSCLYRKNPQDYPTVEQIADMTTILTLLSQKQDDLDLGGVTLYVGDYLLYSKHGDMISGLSEISGTDWYYQLMSDNRQALLFPQSRENGETVLTLARKVRNLQALGEVQAVICIDLPAVELLGTLEQGRTVEGSSSLIVDGEGVPVLYPQEPPVGIDYLALIRRVVPGSALTALDDRYFVQSKRVDNTDWHLVLLVSRSQLLISSIRAWLGVILLILAAAVPTLLLARRILSGMTGRIQALGKHMQSVRTGMLEPTASDLNRDEIGVMTDDYNYMIMRMQDLLQEQYFTGMEAQAAELLALQSQINPHFLYNTLDMVQWMARNNNTQEIQTTVKALTKFYRLTLSRGYDVITLGEELQIVQNYMIIQHLRFGDNVHLSVEVEEQLLDCKIPKITLQPIIENALLHGILPKEDKSGTIKITGVLGEGEVFLSVEDDGVGFEENEAADRRREERKETEDYGKSGYGLYNIERRLSLVFGVERCIEVRSKPGEGTAVTLRFPFRK
ncbi:MAG: sensor histidine kinase [Oscillospiraceae bacterium]